jgi:hypothetical protein
VKRGREFLSRLPPYQVVLAAFGIAVGLVPGLPHVTVRAALILAVFVPALVFEAALNLNLKALRSVALPVALLVTFGVVMSIGTVGALCHFLIGLDWASAILLGAILSPTDPIAVVAVVRRSGAPARLAALLEGESLFNDATGVTAFTAVLAAVVAGGALSPAQAGSTFLVLTLGGIAIGVALGLPAAALVRSTRNAPLEVTAQPVRLLQRADLLLAASQPDRGLSGGRLVRIEPDELRVGVPELPGQLLRLQQGPPAPRRQQPDQKPGGGEGEQVHDVLPVGDRERADRRHEKVVDQEKAVGRGQQRRPESAKQPEHGHGAEVEEDVVALEVRGGEEDGGQGRRRDDRPDPRRHGRREGALPWPSTHDGNFMLLARSPAK